MIFLCSPHVMYWTIQEGHVTLHLDQDQDQGPDTTSQGRTVTARMAPYEPACIATLCGVLPERARVLVYGPGTNAVVCIVAKAFEARGPASDVRIVACCCDEDVNVAARVASCTSLDDLAGFAGIMDAVFCAGVSFDSRLLKTMKPTGWLAVLGCVDEAVSNLIDAVGEGVPLARIEPPCADFMLVYAEDVDALQDFVHTSNDKCNEVHQSPEAEKRF